MPQEFSTSSITSPSPPLPKVWKLLHNSCTIGLAARQQLHQCLHFFCNSEFPSWPESRELLLVQCYEKHQHSLWACGCGAPNRLISASCPFPSRTHRRTIDVLLTSVSACATVQGQHILLTFPTCASRACQFAPCPCSAKDKFLLTFPRWSGLARAPAPALIKSVVRSLAGRTSSKLHPLFPRPLVTRAVPLQEHVDAKHVGKLLPPNRPQVRVRRRWSLL
jgi:hypothetical protein